MVLDGHERMTYVNLLTVSIGQVQKALAVLSFLYLSMPGVS